MYESEIVLYDSEFYEPRAIRRPAYQGPVERVANVYRPHPINKHGYYPATQQGMGFFIIDDIVGFIISIVIFVKKLYDFVKAIIEGSLISALMSIITFVLPIFEGVVNFANLGLDWINNVVASIQSWAEGLAAPLIEQIQSALTIPGIGDLTQLDVFDSLSSYTGLDFNLPLPGLKMPGLSINPLPSPQDWLEQKANEYVDEKIDAALEKTGLGRLINKAKKYQDIAEQGEDIYDDPSSVIPSDIPDDIPIADLADSAQATAAQLAQDTASQAASAATQAAKDSAVATASDAAQAAKDKANEQIVTATSKIESAYTSLEDRLQLDIKIPSLSLDDVLGFFMQFLRPGQTLQDLSPNEFTMIANKLREEYPGFEIPPFDLSALMRRSSMMKWMGPFAMMAMLGVGAWFVTRRL
jgi:hypothetical protein